MFLRPDVSAVVREHHDDDHRDWSGTAADFLPFSIQTLALCMKSSSLNHYLRPPLFFQHWRIDIFNLEMYRTSHVGGSTAYELPCNMFRFLLFRMFMLYYLGLTCITIRPQYITRTIAIESGIQKRNGTNRLPVNFSTQNPTQNWATVTPILMHLTFFRLSM